MDALVKGDVEAVRAAQLEVEALRRTYSTMDVAPLVEAMALWARQQGLSGKVSLGLDGLQAVERWAPEHPTLLGTRIILMRQQGVQGWFWSLPDLLRLTRLRVEHPAHRWLWLVQHLGMLRLSATLLLWGWALVMGLRYRNVLRHLWEDPLLYRGIHSILIAFLGALILPWAAASLGAAVIFANPDLQPLAPKLRSYWLNIHPILLMTAYAAFANAFGVAVALLIQERQIKSRKPTELCYRLPSLDELDALNGRIIAAAFPLLAAGLLMGSMWSYSAHGHFWIGGGKECLSLTTAAVYAAFLWLRYGAGRRGRTTVYVSLLGFAFVLLTFFVPELMSGRHSYMAGGE